MFEKLSTFTLGLLVSVICINSSFMIYLYIALKEWYFMPFMSYFWHTSFYLGPLLILVVGIYKLVVVLYAIAVSFSRFPFLYIGTPALLGIALFIEIADNYVFWDVKTQISLGNPGADDVVDFLFKYGNGNFTHITSMIDNVQHQLRCCGGNGWIVGYSDYRNTPLGAQNDSVPDSCCINVMPNCGCNLFRMSKEAIKDILYVNGCVDVLIQQLTEDVLPWLETFSGILIVLTLIEIGLSGLLFYCVKMIWDKEHPPEEEEGFSQISQHNIQHYGGDESPYNYSRENYLNNFDLVQSPSSPSETMC